jgi:hypothetical protein
MIPEKACPEPDLGGLGSARVMPPGMIPETWTPVFG